MLLISSADMESRHHQGKITKLDKVDTSMPFRPNKSNDKLNLASWAKSMGDQTMAAHWMFR